MNREAKKLTEIISSVPEKPGVYIFKDRQGRVLYIGKAKNLKTRLRSYFQRFTDLSPRIEAMLKRAEEFSFVVTENELEALALEASLIKQQKPRYNIILRDDKNYPYLKLTLNEDWPTLEVVRRIKRDGAKYFGPYIPASSVWETLAFIRKHFQIRPCRYRLDRPIKPCIQKQMGRCPAPCAGGVSRKEYMKAVKQVERFLKGQKKELIEELETKMKRLSEELRFEEAAKVRDRLIAVKKAFDSQKVVSPEIGNMDVIGFWQTSSDSMFMVLFIRSGVIVGTKDFMLRDTKYLREEELIEEFMKFFYAKEMVMPDEIILQILPSDWKNLQAWLSSKAESRIKIRKPKNQKEKELIEMAKENARVLLSTRMGAPPGEVLERLKERLNLRRVPESIGGFDVSTIFGSYSVGAFVWWERGEFVKENYRHLRIKEVTGIDDYSMMAEILKRTLKNLGPNLPDMIMIDGGKGHLETATKAISEVVGDRISDIDIVGITKDPDRVVLPDGRIVPVDDASAESVLLRKIRDEVHRFAITFHRRLRTKETLTSPLERIKGIGKKRRLALLRRFSSIDAIRHASVEEIASVEGMNRPLAERVLQELSESSDSFVIIKHDEDIDS
jgi:excinuclease ABC subunit C